MKITAKMIEDALPEVMHLPPLSDDRALVVAKALSGVYGAGATAEAS